MSLQSPAWERKLFICNSILFSKSVPQFFLFLHQLQKICCFQIDQLVIFNPFLPKQRTVSKQSLHRLRKQRVIFKAFLIGTKRVLLLFLFAFYSFEKSSVVISEDFLKFILFHFSLFERPVEFFAVFFEKSMQYRMVQQILETVKVFHYLLYPRHLLFDQFVFFNKKFFLNRSKHKHRFKIFLQKCQSLNNLIHISPYFEFSSFNHKVFMIQIKNRNLVFNLQRVS